MNTAPAAPPRRLVLLTAGVLAAHFWLLQANVAAPLQTGETASRVFDTRTIAAAPPPAPATETAIAPPRAEPARPAPRPRRIARPAPEAPAEPAPTAAPALVSTAEPAPGTDARQADSNATPPSADAAAAIPATAAASDASPATAAAFAVLAPARLRYEVVAEVRGIPLNGHAELQWRHDGQQYEARLEASAPLLPSRVQRSQGRITPEGLAPTYFSDRSRSEQATHFDREKGRIVFSNNRPDAPLAAGMQDRLSVVLQLAALVAGQPERYPAGAQIVVPTASTREAENWVFTVVGEENLQLPGGAMRALKLQRLPRKEFDQKVELWLAPRMDYAPVRLRLTNPNGDAVDQRWSSTDKG